MINQVKKFLIQENLTIAAAESFTGGLCSYNLCKDAGASSFLKGGIVAYDRDAKINVLKINEQLIIEHGQVSSQVAIAMAKQATLLFNADIGLGFTGNAGPDSLEDKPAGLVYWAIYNKNNDKTIFGEELLDPTFRNQNQETAINNAFKRIMEVK